MALGETEHIRCNPGMYIGETSDATHLIEEILDNALDESLAGYSNIVAVNINTKDNIFSVIDNGRGIPIDNNVPILISTKLFTGSKFKHKKTAYDISSGLHGVGLVAVNALSTEYKIIIYRDGKKATFNFLNSKHKCSEIKKFKGEKPYSTFIEFKPDPTIFESLTPNIDRIRKRLKIASTCLPDCTFVLVVNDEKEIIKISEEDYFKEVCTKDEETTLNNIIEIDNKKSMFKVRFCYSMSGSITPRIGTSVNLLPVDNGGSHVNYFCDILKDILQPIIKKNNLKIQPNDCLYGFRAFISLYLSSPEFSSQTKERLSNKKTEFELFTKKLKTDLTNYFEENNETLLNVLKAIEAYRVEQNSKKIKALGTQHKRSSTIITKLRDCTSDKGDLFIVEGDSAAGSLTQCRNPRLHAVYPIKGKTLNIVKKKDITENAEINGLIQALGAGSEKLFDINKLRYNRIIITVDADDDGKHIGALLILTFAVLFPEIIKTGRLFLASTPLYAIIDKGLFIPLWSEEEVKKAIELKKRLTRFKGLGELDPQQLKVCVIEEKTKRWIPIEYSSNINYLIKLFDSVEEKRKLLEG